MIGPSRVRSSCVALMGEGQRHEAFGRRRYRHDCRHRRADGGGISRVRRADERDGPSEAGRRQARCGNLRVARTVTGAGHPDTPRWGHARRPRHSAPHRDRSRRRAEQRCVSRRAHRDGGGTALGWFRHRLRRPRFAAGGVEPELRRGRHGGQPGHRAGERGHRQGRVVQRLHFVDAAGGRRRRLLHGRDAHARGFVPVADPGASDRHPRRQRWEDPEDAQHGHGAGHRPGRRTGLGRQRGDHERHGGRADGRRLPHHLRRRAASSGDLEPQLRPRADGGEPRCGRGRHRREGLALQRRGRGDATGGRRRRLRQVRPGDGSGYVPAADEGLPTTGINPGGAADPRHASPAGRVPPRPAPGHRRRPHTARPGDSSAIKTAMWARS